MDFYGAAEISEVLDKAKAKALTDVVFSDTVSTSPPFYFDDSEFKITTDRPDGVGAKKSEKGQSREKEEEQQITVVFARTEGTEEGEEGGDDGCEFKPVKPEKPSKASLSSLLTAAIGPAGGGDDGEGETIVGPSIELTIYLPSKESITVRVGEDATAKKCIEGVIRQQNGQGKKPALRSSADKYELRMVEEDGSVDTDLPPLDAQRLVKSFGDTMFALCLKPGAADEKEDVQSLATAQVGHLLKVHLPHGLGVLSEKVEPSMSLMQVFESVFRRLAARVKQLFIQQDYYFRPPGVSAQPNLSGGYEQKYELQHTIKQLNISEVELAEKVYADRPVAEAPAILEEEEAVVDDELTSQAAMFRLNDMTAAQMTEYDVTKTNEKNHKTEKRRLGIDYSKVYNLLPKAKSVSSSARKINVKRPERLIRDICSLEYVREGDKTNFQKLRIIFADRGEHQAYLYEVEHPSIAAEIMAKLRYLMEKHKHNGEGTSDSGKSKKGSGSSSSSTSNAK